MGYFQKGGSTNVFYNDFFVSGFKAHLVNFKINLCGAQNGFRAQVYCCGHYPSAAPDGSRNQSATHQCYVLDASTAT